MRSGIAALTVILGFALIFEAIILDNSIDIRIILLGNMALAGGLLSVTGLAYAAFNDYQVRLAKVNNQKANQTPKTKTC